MYTLLIAQGTQGVRLKSWLAERGGDVVPMERDHLAATFVRGSDPPLLIVRDGVKDLEESALLDVPIEAGVDLPPTIVLCDAAGADLVRSLQEPSLHPVDADVDKKSLLAFLDRLLAADDSGVALQISIGGKGPELHLGRFVGESPTMQRVYESLRRAGPHPKPVLVTGESGTGKELAAQAIHELSKRKGPFRAVNCGAIPDTLIEAFLFGYCKGAFTGATSDKKGLFEDTDGGTVFLDEIGEMPLDLQVRLLRVLQEGEIQRIGETAHRKVDIRIVAATHRDLQVDIADKRFRQDLYFRLAVLPIRLPPLRERGEDVGKLISHVGRFALKVQGSGTFAFTRGAVRAMEQYDWPGNIRELENVLTQLLVFAESAVITVEDLPTPIRMLAGELDSLDAGIFSIDNTPALPEEGMDLRAYLDRIQRTLIEQALERTGGNRARAAGLLGLARPTLIDRIKRFGIKNDSKH